MRKTRLVLIPGVKSLDTIGCLLLFLACPTIAFKGQENREVDTICKAQNLKEFWVDSPWPGDAENIGWARGFGGGNWPGKSQQDTCNDRSTRSVVRSGRSDDRRVQVRRDIARDDGFEIRRTRLDNEVRQRLMRDGRRDSRRLSDEERRQVRDQRRESVSLDREVKFPSVDSRTVTKREIIDARRSSRVSAPQEGREIRMKREVRGTENRRSSEISDPTTVGRRIVSNRETIDLMRRESRLSIRSSRTKSENTQARNIESRRTLGTYERAELRNSDERRSIGDRRLSEGMNRRLLTRSLERDVSRQDQRTPSERTAERNLMSAREDTRTESTLSTRSLNRRSDSAESRGTYNRERTDSRVPYERRELDSRRTVDGFPLRSSRRDSRSQTEVGESGSQFRSSRRISESQRERNNGKVSPRRSADTVILRETRSESRTDAENRRNNRLFTQSVNRQIRSDMEVRDLQNRKISRERDSRGSVDSAFERGINSRGLRDNFESTAARLQRDSRESRQTDSLHRDRRVDERIQRATRLTRSLERIQSIDDNREVRRQEINPGRFSRRSFENERISLRSIRDDIRNPASVQRSTRSEERMRADRADIKRETERSQDRVNERSERTPRLTRSLDRVRSTDDNREIRRQGVNPRRFLRRSFDNERINLRSIRDDGRNSASVQRSTRSLERMRTDRADIRKETERSQDKVNVRSQRTPRLTRSLDRIQSTDDNREVRRQDINPGRFPRRSFDNERINLRSIRDDIRNPASVQRSTRSEERMRVDRADIKRETERSQDRREMGRESGNEKINRERFMSRRDEKRINAHERLERQARSSEDVRRSDLRIRLTRDRREVTQPDTSERLSRRIANLQRVDIRGGRVDTKSIVLSKARNEIRSADIKTQDIRRVRDDTRLDNRRSSGDRLTRNLARTIPERQTQNSVRTRDATRTFSERRVHDVERADIRRVWDDTRLDIRRSSDDSLSRNLARTILERQTQKSVRTRDGSERRVHDIERTDIRRERDDTRVNNRRSSDDSLSRNLARTIPERQTQKSVQTRDGSERRVHDEERTDIRREWDRSQTRLLRKARSLEEVTRSEPRMPSVLSRHESTRVLNRRNQDVILSRTLFRNNPEGIREDSRVLKQHRDTGTADERRTTTDREARRIFKREALKENREIRRVSADIRRMHRDTESRRLLQDVSLKTDFILTYPKDTRRSDRQRNAVNVDRDMGRFAGKRLDRSLPTESFRRLSESNEPTMKPQLEGKVLNSAKKHDYFHESPKNGFASWLTADIRTDLNGIAETLMYGGIACFALFSNVNKKVIF